ncbi:MAG: ABC transporter substrate-binding protein [Gaiellaceae bacterium]
MQTRTALLGLLGILLLSAGCAPTSILRDGVEIPYEQAATEDLNKARKLVDERKLAAAQDVLEHFVAELPYSRQLDQARFLLAEVYERQGQRERAAMTWEKLVREHNRSPRALEASVRSAETFLDLGRPELALRVLERAPVRAAPAAQRVRIFRLRADAARASGNYEEAVRALAFTRRDVEDEETRREVDLEVQELVQGRLRNNELLGVLRSLPRGPVHDSVILELASRSLSEGNNGDALDYLDRLPVNLRPTDDARRQQLRRLALRTTQGGAFTLGLALPLSGPYQPFGQAVLRGVISGLDLYGEEPTPIRVVVRDTEGDPDRVPTVMSDLLSRGVHVIIGPMRSVVAEQAIPYADRAGVPILSPAPREDLVGLSPYYFRLGLGAAEQVDVLANYAESVAKKRTFAILYPQDDYGRRFKNLFWDVMEERGWRIVGVEGYTPGKVDVQPEIKRLVGLSYATPSERKRIAERDTLRKRRNQNREQLADPRLIGLPPYVDFDAIFIPDTAERAALILPQLRFFDVTGVAVLGTNDWNNEKLLEIAGVEARGALFTAAFFADSDKPATRAFSGAYRAQFGAAPDLSAAVGYDVALLLRKLVDQHGSLSSSGLQRDLRGTYDIESVTGLSGFDADGNPRRGLQLLRVRRGKFIPVDEVFPASGD